MSQAQTEQIKEYQAQMDGIETDLLANIKAETEQLSQLGGGAAGAPMSFHVVLVLDESDSMEGAPWAALQ